eukprot:3496007-Pleurochrysis_carterae.AAC.8
MSLVGTTFQLGRRPTSSCFSLTQVVVVSEAFESKPLIARHRLVNDALQEELAGPIHALSIVAKTPEQWEKSGGTFPKSPPCMGGSKR